MTPSSTRNRRATGLVVSMVGLIACVGASAHHGSSISYDTSNLWTTWVSVTQFNYLNPHPTMTFDRIVTDGAVEHWVGELLTNPSTMARQGWTRRRTLEGLKPGTRVKLYLATARAGGFSSIVMKIENENGEEIGGVRPGLEGVDLDGVPGGLQPAGDIVLPGQPSQ